MMNLSNKYNVRIIRIYGAAGQGKGLIDAMYSFKIKAILEMRYCNSRLLVRK